MNLTINPGAALDNAKDIENIVAKMEESMEQLNVVFDRTIPTGIETTWSQEVKENWTNYYGNDIPEAMAEMRQSAANLRMAVDAALKYSESNM